MKIYVYSHINYRKMESPIASNLFADSKPLVWTDCLQTRPMNKLHIRMIILISEVYGSIINETYKSMAKSYSPEVLQVMFSKGFLFETVSEVFRLTYENLSQQLLDETVNFTSPKGSQLFVLTTKILKEVQMFPKDLSYIYIFNASMMMGLQILNRLDFSEEEYLTEKIIKLAIAEIGLEEKEFGLVHYQPEYEFPVSRIIIK